MKNVKFEKIKNVVTKTEMALLKGGYIPPADGSTDSMGDTYVASCACYQSDTGRNCIKDCGKK